jgi:negative regulator of genetic competence, sporulation and motility
MIFDFEDFEHAIQLSHFMKSDYEIQEETLYHYKRNITCISNLI